MKLYDCKIAPSPRRVRIFLAEKGLDVEKVEVDLLNAENLKDPFLAVNPRGLVPTLVLDDGTAIDECVAICRYIEETVPNPNLMGRDPKSRALIESRNRHMEIDGFNAVADTFRNSSPGFAQRGLQGIPEPVPAIPQLVERGMAGIRRFYSSLDAYLSRHEFAAGNEFTIADITALCVVDFAGWVKQNIPDGHRHTRRWYDAVSKRPSASA
ncbi:MAG TPA: glutathione S-transferase family protein [Nevskiaceae bacterium]|nr:glutathione S-transferase family protein [Nevskiaceae bacterium]